MLCCEMKSWNVHPYHPLSAYQLVILQNCMTGIGIKQLLCAAFKNVKIVVWLKVF